MVTWSDWSHGACDYIFTSLTVHVEFFVLYVQTDKRIFSVQPIIALEISRIHSWIRWTLDITCLQSTFFKCPITIAPLINLNKVKTISVQYRWVFNIHINYCGLKILIVEYLISINFLFFYTSIHNMYM